MQYKLKQTAAEALCVCALFCVGCESFGSSLLQKDKDSSVTQWPAQGQVPHTALRPRPEPADELNWFERMIGMEEDPAPPETIHSFIDDDRPGMGGSLR